ncbi:MAG: YbaB/EbfC family nucleoid-associated protein [Planctomycetota bacterium]
MFDQLRNLRDLASMMGNLGDIKGKAEGLEQKLAEKTVEAESGAGAVRVVMNGKCEVQSLRIEPAMLVALTGGGSDADREMVEDLVAAAFNAAVTKAHDLMREAVTDLAGGMSLPE